MKYVNLLIKSKSKSRLKSSRFWMTDFKSVESILNDWLWTLAMTCFSSNQFRIKFLNKKLLSRNFCEKMVAVKFCNFHTVPHCAASDFLFDQWKSWFHIISAKIRILYCIPYVSRYRYQEKICYVSLEMAKCSLISH